MNVLSVERGERPATMTKARIIAPQAVKYLSSLLEDEVFADKVAIVVDWRGDMAWSQEGEMPADMRQPCVLIETYKWYPQHNAGLRVDLRLDIEDFFGADNATKDDLHEVVEALRTKVREEENRRTN